MNKQNLILAFSISTTLLSITAVAILILIFSTLNNFDTETLVNSELLTENSNLSTKDTSQQQNAQGLSGSNIPNLDNLTPEQERGLQSWTYANNGTRYVNNLFGFGLTLPDSWGLLFEEYIENEYPWTETTIRLKSIKDPNRHVSIRVISESDANLPDVFDFPAIIVGNFAGRVYLLSSGADFAGLPGMEGDYWYGLLKELQDIIIPSFGTGDGRL
jgi:hypothetical protein